MGQRVFTVRGRVVHANGAPAPQIWVSIVDADRGDPDDLLGIGRSNAAGEFRLSFTTCAFNQEPDERETVPDLYFVLAVDGKATPIAVCRHHIGERPFVGEEDVGALALPLLPVAPPLPTAGLRHAPESDKRARRIRLDDDLVGLAAAEVAPIVESLTGWSGLLDAARITIVDSMFEPFRQRVVRLLGRDDFTETEVERLGGTADACRAATVAMWDPTLETIFLNRHLLERWPLDVLKVTLGHELVHVGQSLFHHDIDRRLKALHERSVRSVLAGEAKSIRQDDWHLMANLEGYAQYIEEKYLLAIYTHGVQIVPPAREETPEQERQRQIVIRGAIERVESLSPRELSGLQDDDSFETFALGKKSQYEAGMAAYLARTASLPVPFDPALEVDPLIDKRLLEVLAMRADSGCAVSQQALGWLYLRGEGGVPKNDAVARFMLRLAAENGLPSAAFLYASLLPDGPERARWLRVAASWGLAAAQHELGRLLLQKDTPHHAPPEAMHWLEKAAEQGDVDSMHTLALLHIEGADVPEDRSAAFAWMTKAAEHGSVPAMRRLVVAYTHGIGTGRDLVSARLWEKRADRAEAEQARLRNT